MFDHVRHNAGCFGNGPFTVKPVTGRYGNSYLGIYNQDGHCVDLVTFNGNAKQRRQQRRKLIRNLNQ